MSTIQIGDGLALPPDYATTRAAIVAMSGGGKTYTAAVVAEEMVAAGQPFYALDPTGAWWGLRADADGRPGLPVVVIGGEHGDLPLDPASGAAVADLIVDYPNFYVIDMGSLDTRAAEIRFATAFLERLYRRKNKKRFPLHGFWDEADLFAPQFSGKDEARMLGAAESVVRRGRIRGLGTTMITQRPAVLNKNVLSQVKVLVALSLNDPRDRKAIKEWLDGTPDAARRAEVLSSLGGELDLGEAWVYAPQARPVIYARGQVRERRTFNSSADGAGEDEDVVLADVDVVALAEQMAATIEKVKAEDPKALRERIRTLEAELGRRSTSTLDQEIDAVAELEARDQRIRELEREVIGVRTSAALALEQLGGAARSLVSSTENLRSDLNAARAAFAAGTDGAAFATGTDGAAFATGTDGAVINGADSTDLAVVDVPSAPTTRVPTNHERLQGAPPSRAAPLERPAGAAGVPPEERPTPARQKIIDALAWFAQLGITAPRREALAPLAGSKATSGGFRNNLGALRTAGLIDYPTTGCVSLTDAGSAAAVWPERAGTSEDLQAAVLATLTPARQAILRNLIAVYPTPVTREHLAATVDVPASSGGFRNNLGAMRTQGVIDYPQQGEVRAADLLFLIEKGHIYG